MDALMHMPAFPSHSRPAGSEPVGDLADVTATAANWYGQVLSARPHMTDHNAKPETRHWLMKTLLADAKHFFGLATDQPVPPAATTSLSLPAIAYLHQLVSKGPDAETRSNLHSGERRELLKAGLGAWVEEDRFAATDAGRALFAAGGVVLSGQEDAA